jgi:hypothetical protein
MPYADAFGAAVAVIAIPKPAAVWRMSAAARKDDPELAVYSTWPP